MTESKSSNEKKSEKIPIRHEGQQEEKKREHERLDRKDAEYERKMMWVVGKRGTLTLAACQAGIMLAETHPVAGLGVALSAAIAFTVAAYNDDHFTMTEPELVPGFENMWNRWRNIGGSTRETGSVDSREGEEYEAALTGNSDVEIEKETASVVGEGSRNKGSSTMPTQ